MSKIVGACIAGHGITTTGSWDSGCSYGKYTEAEIVMPITKSCTKHLRASGIEVFSDSDTKNNKNMIVCVAEANKKKCKFYVSIHIDYYKAVSGVMPLYVSAEGKKLAKCIETAVVSGMKMKSRGICKRTDLFELNSTDAVACVLECGSIKNDLALLTNKPEQYGKCVAKGICAYLGVKFVEANSTSKASTTGKSVNYHIQTKDEGTTCYANHNAKSKKTTIKGIYTIVEEYRGYGKLKSGAGWVKLDDVKKVTASSHKVTTSKTKVQIPERRQKFINYLEAYGAEIEKSFKYHNTESRNSWAQAVKNRKVNCARYVGWALQGAGILPKGKYFYWKGNKLRGNAATLIAKAKGISFYRPNKTAKELAKDGKLKKGDIVLSKNCTHTQVFRSYNSKTGALHWYSAGGSNVKKKNVRYARQSGYDNKKVLLIIRIN